MAQNGMPDAVIVFPFRAPWGLPWWLSGKESEGKESAYNAGDLGSIPGSGDPLEKGMSTHASIFTLEIP